MTKEELYKLYVCEGLTKKHAARAVQLLDEDKTGIIDDEEAIKRMNMMLNKQTSRTYVNPEFNKKCKEAGVAPRADLLNRYPDKSEGEIILELKKSKEVNQICKSIGISRSSVNIICKNLDIDMTLATSIATYLSSKSFPYKKFVLKTRTIYTNAPFSYYARIIDRLELHYGGVKESLRVLSYGYGEMDYNRKIEVLNWLMEDYYKLYKKGPKDRDYIKYKKKILLRIVEKYKNNLQFNITQEMIDDALNLITY